MTTSFNERFRVLCLKVADETDPRKLELLKQRLRLLLLAGETREKEKEPPSDVVDDGS